MKYLALLLLVVSLSACNDMARGWEYAGTATPMPPGEMVEVGHARMTGTVEAALIQRAEATLQAAKAEQKSKIEIDLIMAPIQAEQTQLALSVAAGQITAVAAQATSTAQANQTTATVQAGIATQTAQVAMSNQVRNERMSWVWSIVEVLLATAGFLVFALTLSYMARRWQDIDIKEREARLSQSSAFVAAAVGAPPEKPVTIPPESLSDALFKSKTSAPDDFIPFEDAPARKAISPDGDTTTQVMAFLAQAISIAGPQANKVPRFERMNVTSLEWQEYTDWLVEAGVLNKVDRSGSKLVGYPSLGALQAALIRGDVQL